MEIKIKHIGQAKGTVGWLASGLESGDLYLLEGEMQRNGNHGLWLQSKKDGNVSTILAAFNAYNLTEAEVQGCNRYKLIDSYTQGQWGSDAFWATLQDIAQQWCDNCNAALDNEQQTEIKIVRVTAKEMEVAA